MKPKNTDDLKAFSTLSGNISGAFCKYILKKSFFVKFYFGNNKQIADVM